MKQCDYKALAPAALAQIPAGAFLMTANNPMTIGWCQFGEIWSKPVCTVLVRKSRYSHGLMEESETFTVSVPRHGDMKEAIAYCGAHSGRDGDKLAALGRGTVALGDGMADGLAGCALHFACRRLFSAESDLSKMDPAVRARFYGANQATPDGDPHTVYFGEILAAFEA